MKKEIVKYREDSVVLEEHRRIAAGLGLSLSDFVRMAVRNEAARVAVPVVATIGLQPGHNRATAGWVSPAPPSRLAQSASQPSPDGGGAFVGEFLKIAAGQHAKFARAFPGRDLAAEYERMESWLASNPTRRKKTHHAFAHRWLTRAANQVGAGTTNGKGGGGDSGGALAWSALVAFCNQFSPYDRGRPRAIEAWKAIDPLAQAAIREMGGCAAIDDAPAVKMHYVERDFLQKYEQHAARRAPAAGRGH